MPQTFAVMLLFWTVTAFEPTMYVPLLCDEARMILSVIVTSSENATITPLENDRVRVEVDEPQRAITPGQATVFYRGDEVVGGGWIVKSRQ